MISKNNNLIVGKNNMKHVTIESNNETNWINFKI